MGVAGEYLSRTRIGAHFHEARNSRKLVLLIVALALLLDNMLLTTVGEWQSSRGGPGRTRKCGNLRTHFV